MIVIQKHDYSFVFVFNGIHELRLVGYYPFGKELGAAGVASRYGYQGNM